MCLPMRKSPFLVAVVVTHNRQAQLQQTLDRLLASSADDLAAVVVVDNASTDGTAACLRACADARLRVETLPTNQGGAGGFAHGMRMARSLYDPDWIVVMDDDARPEADCLRRFRDSAEDGRLSGLDGVAAAVRHPDGAICRMNRPTLNPFAHPAVFLRTLLGGGRGAFHLDDAAFAADGLQPIDGASFVGLFLSRRALDLAGYPDPALFLYADDAIYTMTLTQRGGRMAFAPGLRFDHDTQSLSAQGIILPLWKVYYYHRNRLILYRLAAGWAFWLLVPLLLWSWPRLGRHYPQLDRPVFKRLIHRAFRDAVRRDLRLTHADVLRLSGQAETTPRS